MIIFLSFYNRRDILWLHSAFNDIVISSIHSFFSQVNRRSWCFCIVRLMNYWMNLHPVMAGQRTISVQISEACNIISHSKFERNHKAEMTTKIQLICYEVTSNGTFFFHPNQHLWSNVSPPHPLLYCTEWSSLQCSSYFQSRCCWRRAQWPFYYMTPIPARITNFRSLFFFWFCLFAASFLSVHTRNMSP